MAVTGQLWYLGQGNPTDARLAYIDINASTGSNTNSATTVVVDNNPDLDLATAIPQEVQFDWAAGLYFVVTNGSLAGGKILMGHIGSTAAPTVVYTAPSEFALNTIQIDPFTHHLYLGILEQAGDPNTTGILDFTYDPIAATLTSVPTNDGFLVKSSQQSAIPNDPTAGVPIFDPRDFALDRSTNQLFWVNETDGSVYTNQIYWLDVTNPTVLHPLLQQSQFPVTTDASPFPNGYITAVEVDSSTDLVYFTTHSQHPSPDATYNAAIDKIYWISETATGSTAATALTISGLPALFYPGKITFDMATRQIYVVSEQNSTGGAPTSDDVIYVLQLDASGHSASLINTLTISNPAFLQDAASVGGMTFDALAEIGALSGTSSHALEQTNLTLLTIDPTITDFEGDHLASATVKVSGSFAGSGDILSVAGAISGLISGTSITISVTTDGSGNKTLTLSGYDTLAHYQQALGDVRFNANSENPTNSGSNTTRTITWQVNDGAIGNPSGTQNATDTNVRTTTITVEQVNDAPTSVITPPSYSATEQVNLNLHNTGLSVADVDSPSGTATLSVGEGTLTISAGATGATIGGSGSGSVTIAGTIAQINAVLAGSSGATIVYVDNTNTPSANTTLTLSMTDGSTSTSDTATIGITPVNDAPAAVITLPTYSATEQVALNLKGTGLSVSDADASGAVETATLSVSEGTLTVTAGGSGAQVSGSGSGTVTITGTIAQINALLDGDATSAVGYTDGTDNPSATATLTLGINDGGSSGTGGPKTGSDTATINITAVNDAPDLTVPGSTVNGTPGNPITINGVTFADGDEGTGPEQATFTAAAGTFTAVDNGGVTVSGSGTNAIALTGTTAALSAFIGANHLTYTTTTSQTVSVTLSDLGHTGTPGALTDSGTFDVSVNVPPSIADLGGDSTGFSEGGAALILDQSPAASVTDADSTDFDGGKLTVTVIGGLPEDSLSIIETASILIVGNSVRYDADGAGGGAPVAIGTVSGGSGGTPLVVTFTSADATPAAVEALIRQIAYQDTNTTDPDGTARTVRFTVNDGDSGTSSSSDVTVSVTPINDEPTLIATMVNPTFTEGGAAADIFSGVTASTIEAGQTFTSMTLTVSNVTDGASEILRFDGSDVALTNANAVLTSLNGLSVTVSRVGTTATVTFTAAALDATQLQTLVDGLSYSNTSQDPTGADRVVTITKLVDSGANGGADDNIAAPGIASTVHVTPVNDEPTLTATAVNPTFTEGGAQVDLFNSVTVSAVEAGQRMTAMSWTVTNVASGANEFITFDNFDIALTDGNSVVTDIDNMTIQVSLVGTTATLSFSGVSVSAPQLRNLINDMSYKNTSQDPGTADRVITITELVDSGANGGADDNTAAPGVATTVHITPVNDEPTLAATALDSTFTEGGAAADIFSGVTTSTIEAGQTFISMTLTVTGVVDGASEILSFDGSSVALTNGNSIVTTTNGLTVTVAVVGTTATLTCSGASLGAVALQTLIDGLAYSNTSQDPTDTDRVVTISELVDSGANGGADDSTAAPGIASTVHVTPVNDEPTLTATAVNPTFTEGGPQVDLFDSVTVSAIEAGQRMTAMTWTVTNVASGANEFIIFDDFEIALTDGNSVVTDIDNMIIQVSLVGTTATLSFSDVSVSAVALRNLINDMSYKNTSQDPGTADRVITITELVDSGSNGGADDNTAALSVASTVHITAINDEPTLAATAVDPTFIEGGAAADIFSGVTASTIEAGQTFTSMTLSVAGVVDGANEILDFDGSPVALTNGNSIVTAINGLTVAVTVAAGVATLTFSGATLDAAQLQTLIDGLSYANASQDPTGGDRVVTVTEVVDSGSNVGPDDSTAAPGIASTVHVAPVNDQPTLSAVAVDPTFTEGGAAVDVFTTPVVASTVEAGQTFTSMTLTVTNVSAGASEILSFDGSDVALTDGNSVVTATNGLTVHVSLTGTTASLTFSGAALDAAHLQSLVDGIAYANTSQDPGTADRVVTIIELIDSGSNVNPDDATAALAIASTVHITAINDQPTLTATVLNPTFTEGAAAADLFGGVSASTVEAGQTFQSMTLTVTGVVDGASEILSFDGSQVALTNGNSVVTGGNGLTVSVAVVGTTATVTFGSAGLSSTALQTLIDGLAYSDTSQDPTDGNRVITITELVDSGSNSAPNDNVAALSIASTVNVDPVNDQPTLSAVAVDPTFIEGGAAVDVFTTPVVASTVEAGQTFTSMTLTVTNVSAGASEILSFDGSSVALTNGNSVVTATNGLTVNVSLAGTTASLTFNGATLDAAHLQSIVDGIAYSNTTSNPDTADRLVTITQLVDSGSNAAPNDSTAAPGITSTVHMVRINHEPSGTTSTITALEDKARVFTAGDFGFTDATDGNTLAAIRITTLPGAGTLKNNGVAVSAGQTISKADIDAGHLTFQAALNASGAAYAQFGFQVQDNGGTNAGGVDLDQTPNTLTVNVTPVNDAPSAVVLSHVHGPFPENTSTAVHIKVADIAVTDVDGGTNNLSLSGADANLFQIIGSALWLKAGASLDFETNPFLNVNVNVNDPTVGGPIDATKALAIAVTDIAENITGTARGDRLIGTNNGETIVGLAGNDGIYGNAGNDRIIGGLGADYMTGGPGNDVFVFNSISDSAPGQSGLVNNGTFSPISGHGLRDIITDFTRGPDKLDLSAIDANNQVGANQAFTFLGRASFHSHHPGELIYRLYDYTGTANDKTIVYGDVNGDARADFQIELTGLKLLTASDFIL